MRRARVPCISGVVVVAVLTATGCRGPSPDDAAAVSPAGACTEIGCGPALMIRFDRQSDWSLTRYRVEIAFDDQAITCVREFPLHCDDAPACPGGDPQLMEIGCALGATEHALGGVEFGQLTPRSLAIEVFENDVAIGSGEYAPSYTSSQPNGPGCEPTCTQAREQTLVLGPPPGSPQR